MIARIYFCHGYLTANYAQETSQATPSNFQQALPAIPINPYSSMVFPAQMTHPTTFLAAPHEVNESHSTSAFKQRQMLQFASFSVSNEGLFSPGYLQQPTSVHQVGSWDRGGSGVSQSFAHPTNLGSTTSAMLGQQSLAGSNREIHSTLPCHTLPSHSIYCQFSQLNHPVTFHGSATHAEDYRAAPRSYFPFQPICHSTANSTDLVLSQHSANFNIERAALRDSIFPYQPINFGESTYHNLDTLCPPINCEANSVHNSILSCQPIKSMEEISANLISSSRPIHAGGQTFQNSIASFQPINLQTPQTESFSLVQPPATHAIQRQLNLSVLAPPTHNEPSFFSVPS